MIKQILKKILPYSVQQKIIYYLSKRGNKKKAKHFYNKNRYTYTPSLDKMRPDTVVGQFTSIANNSWIAPGNHPLDMLTTSPFYYAPYNEGKPEFNERLSRKVMDDNESERAEIGNDVWIGVNTTILQGIKIGDGAVVGANSLVTKDVPPYAIVGGVPARLIRYRFSQNIVNELVKLRWWELPMSDINTLPFDDIEECIRRLHKIREKKKNTKVLFIVTSVIMTDDHPLNYSAIRSIYSEEERNEQTVATIRSIRRQCPNADIWLIEGGKKNYSDIDYDCDRYIYVGDKDVVRSAVDSPYKGVGEVRMLLEVLNDPQIQHYPFVFKLSGRYRLKEGFHIDDFDFTRLNFKNYYLDRNSNYEGESRYRKGSHSTRLYGVPCNMLDVWREALKASMFEMRLLHQGIENVMAKKMSGGGREIFFYKNTLNVEGNIGINGEKIEE